MTEKEYHFTQVEMNYQPPESFVYENAVNGLLKRETDLIQSQIEQKFGVQIDKAKLAHITGYDRLQYIKGFIDGYNARGGADTKERKETSE